MRASDGWSGRASYRGGGRLSTRRRGVRRIASRCCCAARKLASGNGTVGPEPWGGPWRKLASLQNCSMQAFPRLDSKKQRSALGMAGRQGRAGHAGRQRDMPLGALEGQMVPQSPGPARPARGRPATTTLSLAFAMSITGACNWKKRDSSRPWLNPWEPWRPS